MKGLMALVLLALLGLAAYNYWEIRSLREEVALLERKVDQQQAGGLTDAVVARATLAIAQAKEALAHADMDKARALVDSGRRQLDDAVRTAGEKAAPVVKWFRDEASDLGQQVQDKVHAH